MVDSSRKHGPFDSRYPEAPTRRPARVWELRPPQSREGRLPWTVFLERFFPNRRPHDLEALETYDAYRIALDRGLPEWPAASPQSALGADAQVVVSTTPRAPRTVVSGAGNRRAERVPAPSASLLDWESEGGSAEQD
jgi:hypothetical protein